MAHAKEEARASPEPPVAIDVENANKSDLKRLLRNGLDNGHIWPAFQPIVDIHNGNIVSFEVLARWRDPHAGDIRPALFIPRLEHHDLIEAFSDALMTQACSMAADWPGIFSLAFNISPQQLASEDFSRRLATLVSATGFPLNRVEIEVTEGSLISDDNHAYARLLELNALGVKIGIDDFGAGYSNLMRLEAFPFHKLKVDAQFVHHIDTDPGKRRIAAAVIGLGQSLGITTVAEGIETEAEAVILRNFGCDLGQGWLYGKAESGKQALKKLKRNNHAARHRMPLDTSPFQQLHQINSIYDQVPVGLCFLDTVFRYVRTNDRFASLHGLTPADLRGKSIHDILDDTHLQRALRVLERSRRADEPIEENYRLRGRDIKIIYSRVVDDGHDCVGFSIISIDITEENIIKRQAMEERDYANAILDSLPNIFYHYDQHSRLRRWNRKLEKVTGYAAYELDGFDPLNFVPESERPQLSEAIAEVFTNGQGTIETELLIKNGHCIPYLFTGTRFDYKGEQGFVGVGTDMSERRQMEHTLQDQHAFLESIIGIVPDGIFILDPQGRRIIHNQQLSTQFRGLEPHSDAGQLIRLIDRQIRHPANFAERVPALLTDTRWMNTETVELADGTRMTHYTAPLLDQAGQHHGRLWAFRALDDTAPPHCQFNP